MELNRLFSICLLVQLFNFPLFIVGATLTDLEGRFVALEGAFEALASDFGYRVLAVDSTALIFGGAFLVAWLIVLVGLWLRKLWGAVAYPIFLLAGFALSMAQPSAVRVVIGWEEALNLASNLTGGMLLAMIVLARRQLGFLRRSERAADRAELFR